MCVCEQTLLSLSLSLAHSLLFPVLIGERVGVRVVFPDQGKGKWSLFLLGYASMKHSFTSDLVGAGRGLDLQEARLRAQQLLLDVQPP